MGNTKRLMLPIAFLLLLWSSTEIKYVDVKSRVNTLKVEQNSKNDAHYNINIKGNDLKNGLTGTTKEKEVEKVSEDLKKGEIKREVDISKVENNKPNANVKLDGDKKDVKLDGGKKDVKLDENKKDVKVVFLENLNANTGSKNDQEVKARIESDSKEKIKTGSKNDQEVNIRIESDSKEKTKTAPIVPEFERSRFEEVIPKKEVTIENNHENKQNIVETEKKDVVNKKNNNPENEYIDLTTKTIYEEIDKNKKTDSGLHFLQILSITSSIFMQLILFPAIYKILKRKTTGELDGLPYIILVYSSFLWLIYGMLISNSAVVFPNLVGLILGLLYSIVYHKNCKSMWLKQKLYSYYKICSFITFLLYVFLYLLIYEQYKLFVGFIASVSSIISFGAPLSYIKVVIKKKNSSLIPLEMTIGSLICSFLWLTYGITLKDGFLIIPNLIGFFLSILQVILIVLYYNKEPLSYIDNSEYYFNEGSSKYVPDDTFNEYNLENENKRSELSTNAHESLFSFSYDETSPLTGNFILNSNQKNIQSEKYLGNPGSEGQSTGLNF